MLRAVLGGGPMPAGQEAAAQRLVRDLAARRPLLRLFVAAAAVQVVVLVTGSGALRWIVTGSAVSFLAAGAGAAWRISQVRRRPAFKRRAPTRGRETSWPGGSGAA